MRRAGSISADLCSAKTRSFSEVIDSGDFRSEMLSVMSSFSIRLKAFRHCLATIDRVLFDFVELRLATKSRSALMAENLFLRKQLAMFQERNVKPRRAQDSARWLMACLSRRFDWRNALVVVKPDKLIRWHRQGFRLFWRWKSKPPGRGQEPPGVDSQDGG